MTNRKAALTQLDYQFFHRTMELRFPRPKAPSPLVEPLFKAPHKPLPKGTRRKEKR